MSRSDKLRKLIGQALHEKRAVDLWSMGDLELEKRPLSDSEHPGQTAVLLVREALGQFELPTRPELRYQGMRRASGHGQHHLRDGVITVSASFASLSGHKNHIEVPVIVHGGYTLFPEVFLDQQGQPQVMAQSSFDAILRRGDVYERQQDRKNMYSPHIEPVLFADQPAVGRGMFSVTADYSEHVDITTYEHLIPYQVEALIKGEQTAEDAHAQMVSMIKDSYLDENGLVDVFYAAADAHMSKVYDQASSKGWKGERHEAAMARRADHAPHGLDPAERARAEWPRPGEETALADEVQVRLRGGSHIIYTPGTKIKIIRDMAGDGYLYYCEFPDGRRAPVRYDDIR